MAAPPRQWPGLDALRGIAALMVVGLHTRAVFAHPPWFAKGYLLVDFFLMLSGFLMVRTTEPKLAAGQSPVRFMIARYRRFWPMMALGGVIGLPYLWVRSGGGAPFVLAAMLNFALLPFPVDRLIFALNVPAWTAFFELIVNALHVFVLRRLTRVWLLLAGALALAGMVMVALAFGSFNIGARPSHLFGALPRVLLAYVIGMILGRSAVRSLGFPGASLIALLMLPAAIVAAWWYALTSWWFDLAFVLCACPLAIIGALGMVRRTWPGWLSGALSFPLFATHVPVIEGLHYLGYTMPIAVCAALILALAIVAVQNRPRRSSGARISF